MRIVWVDNYPYPIPDRCPYLLLPHRGKRLTRWKYEWTFTKHGEYIATQRG